MSNKKTIVVIGAIACVASCAGDFIVMFVFGRHYPGYSQFINTMSSLGATKSPVSNIVSNCWILLGLLFIIFALGFRSAFSPADKKVNLAFWLLVIYGLGEFVGSGLFKADHIGNTITNSAVIHGILGTIGITALMLLPLVMRKIIKRSSNPGFHKLTWIVFVLGIILLVFFNFRFFYSADNVISINEGLWQRLFALNLYIYLFVIVIIMVKKQFTTQNNSVDA